MRPKKDSHLQHTVRCIRSQRRLNFVETAFTRAASAFSGRFEEEGKLVSLALALGLDKKSNSRKKNGKNFEKPICIATSKQGITPSLAGRPCFLQSYHME